MDILVKMQHLHPWVIGHRGYVWIIFDSSIFSMSYQLHELFDSGRIVLGVIQHELHELFDSGRIALGVIQYELHELFDSGRIVLSG